MEENFTKESSSKIKNENEDKEIRIGNYLITKTLGKGTFGKVKLGIYLPSHKKVAIKILEKKKLIEEDEIIRLNREFEMLSIFNHPNIISAIEIFENKEAYFTAMDYCEGGELFNYIIVNRYLSEEQSAFFFYQLINGLEYIHSLGIVHRDLKPENLLLTKDNILKIIDFGLSNYFDLNKGSGLLNTPCGSPCYASPEMLSGENYDGFKIDIWATGIILFAMLCGYLPFDHYDNDKLFMKILECNIKYPEHLSKNAKDLIKKILTRNPRKRITIPEIKKHPFYLKGKEYFNNNFTVYQVTQSDGYDCIDEILNDSEIIDNKMYLFDWNYKTQILFNNYSKFFTNKVSIIKRNKSYEIDNTMINKKFDNLIKLTKKDENHKKKVKREINLNNNNEKNRKYLIHNNSANYLVKNMSLFCEKIINQYKKEHKTKIKNKFDKNRLNKNKLSYNYQNKKNDEAKELNNLKHKQLFKSNDLYLKKESSKENNKKVKNKNKKIEYTEVTEENNIIKQNNENKYNIKFEKKNIKVNTKKTNNHINFIINKLFVNDKRKTKINKLPKNIKLKATKRKLKSTSTNNSKINNFKNLLNIIKEKSYYTSSL